MKGKGSSSDSVGNEKLKKEDKVEYPPIPAKRYFSIGEVSKLCIVKQHVLRYWEQEFPMLKPVKRKGNRRYYQVQDVMMVRRIRSLLQDQGFTITGARKCLESNSSPQKKVEDSLHVQLIDHITQELDELLVILS